MHLKTVSATVCDIRATDPKAEDEFLIDTNAWYWTTYTRASILSVDGPTKHQRHHYSRFIKKALDKGSILHRCDLTLAELSHTIEDCERRIFSEFVVQREVPLKEYRHGEDEEREQVASEIESAWGQITLMSQCIELTLQAPLTEQVLSDLKRCRMDGYDLFFLQAMKKGKVTRIVTDDSDFATVPEVELYTCNPGLIKLAESQGRLRN
jgi:predicted nucleic acid-binding protein